MLRLLDQQRHRYRAGALEFVRVSCYEIGPYEVCFVRTLRFSVAGSTTEQFNVEGRKEALALAHSELLALKPQDGWTESHHVKDIIAASKK